MTAPTLAAAGDMPFDKPPTIEELLEQARRRIQVTEEELDEARRRRDLLATILEREFKGSRTYVNGSVAHGDALDPLTDIDVGVVVAEAKYTHGPGKKGCSDLQERAADAIREGLKDEFPDLRIEWRGRKRSILVRFKRPVTYGQEDFTADVIVAIDNSDGAGLYIPNFKSWSRSHPEEHTRLIRHANKELTRYTYARVVRLLKHYNRSNQRPLCSWNIKALALSAITSPTRLANGMVTWFDHAIEDLSEGLTEDPAKVADKPISINENMTRTEVVQRLRRSREHLVKALELEADGYPYQAHEQLARFFNDTEMLPFPDQHLLDDEVARKYTADRLKSIGTIGGATAPVVGHHPSEGIKPIRSWGTA